MLPSVALSTPSFKARPMALGPIVSRAYFVCWILRLTSASNAAGARVPVCGFGVGSFGSTTFGVGAAVEGGGEEGSLVSLPAPGSASVCGFENQLFAGASCSVAPESVSAAGSGVGLALLADDGGKKALRSS